MLEELKTTNDLLARGIPPRRLADELIKASPKVKPPAPDNSALAQTCEQRGSQESANVSHVVDSQNSPSKGRVDAPVTIVVFTDLHCTFSAALQSTVERLVNSYPERIRIVWKAFSKGPASEELARTMFAAERQGKFWELYAAILQDPSGSAERHFQAVGLDLRQLRADTDRPETRAKVASDLAQAKALGVKASPTVFVNGRRVEGAYPYETFRKILQDEIRHSRPIVRSGRDGG
jgi:protein-disulfide isomerase